MPNNDKNFMLNVEHIVYDVLEKEKLYKSDIIELIHRTLAEKELTVNEAQQIKKAIADSINLIISQRSILCREEIFGRIYKELAVLLSALAIGVAIIQVLSRYWR